MGLVGRRDECAVIDQLLASAREGLGGTLVVRGQAGIGKTALIDYAVGAADDFLVVRMTGIESESKLGFAALHRLLTPILHQIERLPVPQRDALNSALGLAAGPPADRFLLGLGVMALAGNAVRARERLLTVIDDAQWIDRESLEALAFWGRRLHADSVALIFGERVESGEPSALDGFSFLEVESLAEDAARALLASERSDLDPPIADRIVAETEGNPLALLELAKDLTAEQLIGVAGSATPLPLNRRLEDRYLRQARSLPPETQTLLLLAAADSSSDPALLWQAASIIGVRPEAADSAEAAGLLSFGAQVSFRHPLIRSAVYGGAGPVERRAVHAALAAATEQHDVERRVWHMAEATAGPSEDVASDLERCAERSRMKGSRSAEAALLVRAAELSPLAERAAERRVTAAEAMLESGSPLQAQALLAAAGPGLRDEALRARAERLEGTSWRRLGQASTAAPILLSAALAMRASDGRLSRQTTLEAFEAAMLSGYATVSKGNFAVADADDRSASIGGISVVDHFVAAFTAYGSHGFVPAAPLLRRAVTAMRAPDAPTEELVRWLVLVHFASISLWDFDAHRELSLSVARLARERGDLTSLTVALVGCANAALWTGRLNAAETYSLEAMDVAGAAGYTQLSASVDAPLLPAWKGLDVETRHKAEIFMALSSQLGLAAVATIAHQALATLSLGTGQYQDALVHTRAVFDEDPLSFGNQILPDMVEAAVRVGDLDAAHQALDRLTDRARASGGPWALGLLSRSRALFSNAAAESLFVEAIELLSSTPMAPDVARAHLLFGEWLRRQKRRTDAREQLRRACDMFDAMGALGFAGRARAELFATGERARKRTVEASSDLTSQEWRVARLAAAGETNAEIAALMFISPSTVEYHLRKVFRKLSVTSRRQLRALLKDDAPSELLPSGPT
jgi:DNA-binding CsgD family transcriptional regulator